MKKIMYGAALLLAVFIVVSCATTTAEGGGGSGGEGGAPDTGDYATQKDLDAAFDQVYTAYTGTLIMDGASDYTVVRRDYLTKIAGTKWGNANMYYFPLIMLASRDLVEISDPDLIEVGDKLKIPNLQKNLANSDVKSKIKSYLEEIAVIYDKKGNEENHKKTARELRALAGKL